MVVVFKYTPTMGEPFVEEVKLPDDMTEEEINEEFETWVWEMVIGDHVHWYVKDEE